MGGVGIRKPFEVFQKACKSSKISSRGLPQAGSSGSFNCPPQRYAHKSFTVHAIQPKTEFRVSGCHKQNGMFLYTGNKVYVTFQIPARHHFAEPTSREEQNEHYKKMKGFHLFSQTVEVARLQYVLLQRSLMWSVRGHYFSFGEPKNNPSVPCGKPVGRRATIL